MKSLFVIATGELTGVQMLASEEMLALNTPDGCAWVDGAQDARRTVVQLVTDDFGDQHAVAVPRTPPRPADNAYQTWAWDDDVGDWVAQPTRLWREVRPRAERDQLLVASDWVVMRAIETGTPVPPPWLAYRAALRDLPEQPGFPDSITWPTPPTA